MSQTPRAICLLVSRFPNPSETFIADQAKALAARGAAVRIFALSRGDAGLREKFLAEAPNVEIVEAPIGKTLPGRLAQAPGALMRLLVQGGPWGVFSERLWGEDAASLRLLSAAGAWPPKTQKAPVKADAWLAHYGRWGQFATSLRGLGLIEGPVATIFHGKDMSAYLRRRPNAYARLFRRGDLFLPISDLWRDKLLALGAPEERVLVQRMGVETARFSYAPPVLKPGEPVRLIGVGRLVEKKGWADALSAFALAFPGDAPAEFTLIGRGPLRAALEAQAASLGIASKVTFTGVLSHAQVHQALAAAHLFVLPSVTAADGDMEGVPVALMEAMARGLPVLSTTHSAIPELVAHGVSGLLAPERDPAALAANMKALAGAPERWAEMGAAGAAKVRADFDADAWNDRLLERLSGLER